jgi:hypothetical protein
MRDADSGILIPFPRPTETEVLRLWRAFQAAVGECDQTIAEAEVAGKRFLDAYKAWVGRS